MPGKHVRDDEETDGEEQVAADGSEDLDETELMRFCLHLGTYL